MSSILKALKKLEVEKAARRPDELKINSEILHTDVNPGISAVSIILVSLLLLAGGSGATYLYMKRHTEPAPTQSESSSINIKKPSTAPVLNTEQLPVSLLAPPVNQPEATNLKPKKSQEVQVVIKKAPVKEMPKSSLPPLSPKTADSPRVKTSTLLTSSAVKSTPVLRVNGIAFQDGGSESSVAMINGVQVTTGSIVDGAKVEEIHKNRVKFSYNGEKFEIPLGQSNR